MIKILITTFLFPFNICIEMLFVGLILLWIGKSQRLGKYLVTLGTVLLVGLSSYPVAVLSLGHLERQYPYYDVSRVSNSRYVVVLGGGVTSDPRIPITSQLTPTCLVRLIEGIRLYKQLPGVKLVLSGGGTEYEPATDAEMMRKMALLLGVRSDDIILEHDSRNTFEEALIIKDIVEEDKFLLVTSAVHMPRAMALFRKLGLDPTPAPTNHLIKEYKGPPLLWLRPGLGHFRNTQVAFYEYLARIKERLVGHI